MKTIVFIMLLMPGIVFAQFEKSQKVILLDNPSAQLWVGSIEQLVDFEEDQHAQLMGQARISSLKDSTKALVQIVWTGLSSTLDSRVQVAFEKPMISVFKTDRGQLKKNQQVPISGDPIILLDALERLHAGKVDKIDLKKKKTAHNPKENGRHILTYNEADLNPDNEGMHAYRKNRKLLGEDLKNNGLKQKANNGANSTRIIGRSQSQNTNSSFGESQGVAQNTISGDGISSMPSSSRHDTQSSHIADSPVGIGNTTPEDARNVPFGSGNNTQPNSTIGLDVGTGNDRQRRAEKAPFGSRNNSQSNNNLLGADFGMGNNTQMGVGNVLAGSRNNTQSNSLLGADFGTFNNTQRDTGNMFSSTRNNVQSNHLLGADFGMGNMGIGNAPFGSRNNTQANSVLGTDFGMGNNTQRDTGNNVQSNNLLGADFGMGNNTQMGIGNAPFGSRNNTQSNSLLGADFGLGNNTQRDADNVPFGSGNNAQPNNLLGRHLRMGNTPETVATLPQGVEHNTQVINTAGVPFEIGDATQVPPNAPAEELAEPEITNEVTEEGCSPRIDRVHERVIIQNRCKRLSNGVVEDEGECSDSFEVYPIMKDYQCRSCTDELNVRERRAYSRYQEYWFDRGNNRNNIGEALYVDANRPYPFIDEPSNCPPTIDLVAGVASRQVETVYYNFNNARKMIQECHAPPNTRRIALTKTTEGCNLVHDFPRNISFEQKRTIFTIDGVQHEALSCHQVGVAIPHELVETGCRPFVDLSSGSVTRMVRRKIQTAIGSRFITDECEPEQLSILSCTTEGCEGDYLHDFVGSRSYLKKRYFFPQGTARKYVTPCIRSEDYLAHQTETNGYQHNDTMRTSIPKLALYIEGTEGKLTIDPAQVRGTMGEIPYTFTQSESRATGDIYFEGCYRRIRTRQIMKYERPDGTQYEHDVGPSNPILIQLNECAYRTETQNVLMSHNDGSFWRHGRDVWGQQHRTVTTYPDGQVVIGPWQ